MFTFSRGLEQMEDRDAIFWLGPTAGDFRATRFGVGEQKTQGALLGDHLLQVLELVEYRKAPQMGMGQNHSWNGTAGFGPQVCI